MIEDPGAVAFVYGTAFVLLVFAFMAWVALRYRLS